MLNTENNLDTVWKDKLLQAVISKIKELKKDGVIGVEYNSFVKKIVPPAGSPMDRAKPYEKEEAIKTYLKILSHIIATLPEEFKGVIFEQSESGIGFEGHKDI